MRDEPRPKALGVGGDIGRGSSLTELQLDANQSSSTKLQHNY